MDGIDGIEQHDGGSGAGRQGGTWESEDARIARFSGVVAEVSDPLTWGLDLEDEALTGLADEEDPTCERFVRAYRCFTGEALEVETLRTVVPDDDVEDVVRAACSGALAAPLHADIAAPVGTEPEDATQPGRGHAAGGDFADAYLDYRSAMRALVDEVDEAPLRPGTFGVDGEDAVSVGVTARGTTAVYVVAAGRALVVTGPADLVDRVDVVTQPVRMLLSGRDKRRERG
ncbi:hypothetical protein [Isoptericola cucumis]|uniref:Uncharacterized protein n=1 Tax=Isoptericola cucumis TaxID=1776856 RepID=A0ABQ2B2Z0_9MICO|nr:hypothetical protein [Isoptericola cucumis]GGI04544.1 hypothetical protein GCM10007368_01690 [Isoptericola cucumis]